MKLSVVTTLYKSAPYIEEFVRRIRAEATALTSDYEIVMVDDGSPDDSLDVALKLRREDVHICIIELSRNFGHHKAMMTGLENASGDIIFLIDSDLEEPPELLARFYEAMQDGGWDVVYGVQKERRGGIIKSVGGRLGWWFIHALLPIQIPHNQSTVRLMAKQYVRELVRHKESITAIGGLWVITGFRQTGFIFDKLCRGKSSYSLLTRFRVFMNSIMSFSEKPLYGVFFMGCGIFSLAFLVGCYLILEKLTGKVLSGWISLMVSIWGLSGLIMLCIGLVGLYISRIFIETKNRPYVIIRNQYDTRI